MLDFENQEMMENTCRQALTLVFIEDQTFEGLFEVGDGFRKGTAFPELYKPLKTGGTMRL